MCELVRGGLRVLRDLLSVKLQAHRQTPCAFLTTDSYALTIRYLTSVTAFPATSLYRSIKQFAALPAHFLAAFLLIANNRGTCSRNADRLF